MGEYKPDGTMIREYIWLDDTLVATRSGYAGQAFQYVLTDHLNTPRAVVLPSTNAIIWRWDLTGTAFGEHAAQNNPDGDTYDFVFNLRYPGQYFDSETGLHYNYFRDYEPGTGRYVQSDPIGLAGGTSTFSYVGGRPVSSFDKLGLAEWHVDSLLLVNRPNLTRIPFTDWYVPTGRERRANFAIHSECYTKTYGATIGEGYKSSLMLSPRINVVDGKTGIKDIEFPFLLNPKNIVLNDGQAGDPSTANLAGTARISFTVSGNQASGSIRLGNATGRFTSTVSAIRDGKYEISGDVEFSTYRDQPDTCGCSGNH